jgi:hypothetical protein
MGLFIKQNESRSQLQSKVAADLAERLNKRPLESDETKKSQPAILDNQRTTSPLAWLWIVVGIAAVVGVMYVLMPR